MHNYSAVQRITRSNSVKSYTASRPPQPPSFRDISCTRPRPLPRRTLPRKALGPRFPQDKPLRPGTLLCTLGLANPPRHRRCPQGRGFEWRLCSSSRPRTEPSCEKGVVYEMVGCFHKGIGVREEKRGEDERWRRGGDSRRNNR